MINAPPKFDVKDQRVFFYSSAPPVVKEVNRGGASGQGARILAFHGSFTAGTK